VSQYDNTLSKSLNNKLEEFQKTDEGKDILRDLVEWLFQELIELKFNARIGVNRYERSGSEMPVIGFRGAHR